MDGQRIKKMNLKRLSYSENKSKDKNTFPPVEKLSVNIYELLSVAYGQSPWSQVYISSDLVNENSEYFLLEEDEQLIGLLAISIMMAELEVTNIAIHPDFQGQGLAKLLLTELSGFTGTLFLEVRQSNFAAQKCYEKFGFEIYHTRKNYYDKPLEDALLMRKEQF